MGVTRRERTETGVKQNMQFYVETSKGEGDPTREPRSSRSGTWQGTAAITARFAVGSTTICRQRFVKQRSGPGH